MPNQARTSVGSTFAPDEVGVALHLSRGTATARIGMAQRLLRYCPTPTPLWESGQIDLLKARAIDDATVLLSDEKAGKVEARVLPKAPEQTLAQLKAALARAVIAVDPDGAAERHRAARRDRRVCLARRTTGWPRCGRCCPPRTPPAPSSGSPGWPAAWAPTTPAGSTPAAPT